MEDHSARGCGTTLVLLQRENDLKSTKIKTNPEHEHSGTVAKLAGKHCGHGEPQAGSGRGQAGPEMK